MQQAIGYFTLDEIPNGENLWMLATGTALGVFLAILKTPHPWKRFKKIILIHSVRYSEELIYQDLIAEIKKLYPDQFIYLNSVTRTKVKGSFNFRIPEGLLSKKFQKSTQIEINEDSQFMICGNPEMIKETTEVLKIFGLNKNRRSKPGNITVERYWV
jgi:ferredoxin--NADP+ reductase